MSLFFWLTAFKLKYHFFHFIEDQDYLVHFTSVTPEKLRYRLLNVEADEGIKLTLWYSRSNRLDVYVDDVYVKATNVRIDSNGRYISSMPKGK